MIARLKEGERIIGFTASRALRFNADIGHVVVPLDSLRRVERGDAPGYFVLVAHNGSRMSGTLAENEEIHIETAFGVAKVGPALIQSLSFPVGGLDETAVLRLDFDDDALLPGDSRGEFSISPPARRLEAGGARGGVLDLPTRQAGQILSDGFLRRSFDAMTVLAWTRPAALPPGQQVILSSLGLEDSNGGFQLALGNRRFEFTVRIPANVTVSSNAELPEGRVGEWTSVAAVYFQGPDGRSRLHLFVEGELVGELTTPMTRPVFHTGQPAYIGMNYDSRGAGLGRNFTREFVGQLDDLIVLDRALDADEIREHFRASK